MYIVHEILTRYFKIWSSKPSKIIVDFSYRKIFCKLQTHIYVISKNIILFIIVNICIHIIYSYCLNQKRKMSSATSESEEELSLEESLLVCSRRGQTRILEDILQSRKDGTIHIDINCKGLLSYSLSTRCTLSELHCTSVLSIWL